MFIKGGSDPILIFFGNLFDSSTVNFLYYSDMKNQVQTPLRILFSIKNVVIIYRNFLWLAI